MSKKNFITLVLGTIGGILFALGMCMALLPEWNALNQGIVLGAIGLIILLALALVRRKMAGKAIIIRLTPKALGTLLLGILGTLAFGTGMCLVMVWEMMVPGILVGLVGILLLLSLIPLIKGLH